MELRLLPFPSQVQAGVVVVVSIVVLGFSALGSAILPTDKVCPPVSGKPSCVCKTKKGIIDLTPLGQQGKPRFTNVHSMDDSDADYSFNPCYKFSIDGCSNSYVCSEPKNYDPVSIGDSDEKIYIDSDGNPYLYYDTTFSSVKIHLECTSSKDVSMVSNGIDSGTEFIFTLSGHQVCPKSASIAVGIIGIVIIILFLLVMVLYFVGGGIFLRVRNGPGSDIIIHKTFWKEVPFWIKDGAMFTCRSAKNLVTRGSKNRDSYESIK